MEDRESALNVLEAYQRWGEWLVGLDLAAIAAAAFLYGFSDSACEAAIPMEGKVALLFFGISVLLSSVFLVGNLPGLMARILDAKDFEIGQLHGVHLHPGFWSPLRVFSGVAALSFAFGAIVLAFATAYR